MESLSKNTSCPGCKKEIDFKDRPPVFLQCHHIFCIECLQIQMSQKEAIDNFLNVSCYVCNKKWDLNLS